MNFFSIVRCIFHIFDIYTPVLGGNSPSWKSIRGQPGLSCGLWLDTKDDILYVHLRIGRKFKVTLYIYSVAISSSSFAITISKSDGEACRGLAAEAYQQSLYCVPRTKFARGKLHRVLFMNKSLFMRWITR